MKFTTGIKSSAFFMLLFATFVAPQKQQILLCKPVNALLETYTEKPVPKSGPRGTPGPRGRPGAIDEKKLDEKIDSKMAKLEARIARLEALSIGEPKQDYSRNQETEKKNCPVIHKGKCYIFAKNPLGAISVARGQSKCEELNGKLANVYDPIHFGKIEAYARRMMGTHDDMTYFILGMRYDEKGDRVLLQNDKPSKFIEWYSRFPQKDMDSPQLFMQVNKQPSISSGMYNTVEISVAMSALCEISMRDYNEF